MKALLLALLIVAGCSAAQSKADIQLATITAGCKVGMDLDLDAGEAGAFNALEDGCKKTIHVWMDQ